MADESIKAKDYTENKECQVPLLERLVDRFKNVGWIMPEKQFDLYHAIKNDIIVHGKHSLKHNVCDVGCGLGVGANILSQEAKFVWGIDKEDDFIRFAKQMFAREMKPQVTFDTVNIMNFKRETMKFHVVTMIEVIEHIDDYQKALDWIKRLGKRGKTTYYISSPNRNSDNIQDDTPRNEYHVREWSAAEFYDVMIDNFEQVMLYNHDLKKDVDLDTTTTPLVAKCKNAIRK